ncbi:MAG: AAA family ATPase [Actinobacteria bacterium]|nr:AAA family ATPase [Actinomycetota bacterium]MCL5444602.1 AAA family ATPase [Actinomycetota bacterium]
MPSELELLTFESLAEKIQEFLDNARSEDVKVGWNKLLDIAQSLSGSTGVANDPAIGRHWALTKVRLSGYQGISAGTLLEIEFDPRPGITVLHGPNGSGKSSITDAIETALHGVPREPAATGTGGGAPLWERVHTNRDADGAEVELSLLSGREALSINCYLDANGQPIDHSCHLRSENSSTSIDLAKTTWRSALAGHRPVFAYATVERQVQLAKDLQGFLESLLAFGGCFETFKHAVNTEAESSKTDKQEWGTSLTTAQDKVKQVDEERNTPGMRTLRPVVWPEVTDDPDQWLSEQGLAETGSAIQEVTDDHENRIVKAAAEAKSALDKLQEHETSLLARLATPLRQLHTEAKGLPNSGMLCPVCQTSDVDWLASLTKSIKDLTKLRKLESNAKSKIDKLRHTIESDLTAVHKVIGVDSQVDNETLPGQGESDAFLAAVRVEGLRPTNAVRSSLDNLCAWVASDELGSLVAKAKEASDQLRQWRLARREAVDAFISTWRRVGVNARNYAAWKSAADCLRTLQESLRKERTEALQERTAKRVQHLLADAGLTVRSISIRGTKASIEVLDQEQKSVTLAMLSAGQRNAVLLAPLLAASGPSPFGFLILDDPIHSFDQMRVDRVASILAEMASDRRIIVLTHDERLREHLAAIGTHCDIRIVERDPLEGTVTVKPVEQMWEVLLQDAASVLRLTTSEGANETTSSTNIVRGLCRQALDNALRQFIIQWSSRVGESPDVGLKSLDDGRTTKDRLTRARKTVAADSELCAAVDAAAAHVKHYLRDWNRATHGNPTSTDAALAEIEAAREACQVLVQAGS